MRKLSNCQYCELYRNQRPLLDGLCDADIMWVGLSAKKVDCVERCIPLSLDTNSGKLIKKIENRFDKCLFYKTNLVKCLPLDGELKLRYPKEKEKCMCYDNLLHEISVVNPKIVFLLGKNVSEFVLSRYNIKISKLDENFKYDVYVLNGINFAVVHHPSYIYVYKRKRIEEYISGICKVIEEIK